MEEEVVLSLFIVVRRRRCRCGRGRGRGRGRLRCYCHHRLVVIIVVLFDSLSWWLLGVVVRRDPKSKHHDSYCDANFVVVLLRGLLQVLQLRDDFTSTRSAGRCR